jgi:hypothetical protein
MHCYIWITRDSGEKILVRWFLPNIWFKLLYSEKARKKITKSPKKNFKLQVNLFQEHLFLHQLTHDMTKDCSLNQEFSTWKFQAQNMLTCVVCIDCSEYQNKNNLCTQHVLSLEFSCTELVIQWTIYCHNVG